MYDGLESDPDRIQNMIFYSAESYLLWILQYHRAAVRVNIYFASADMRKKKSRGCFFLTAAALQSLLQGAIPFLISVTGHMETMRNRRVPGHLHLIPVFYFVFLSPAPLTFPFPFLCLLPHPACEAHAPLFRVF